MAIEAASRLTSTSLPSDAGAGDDKVGGGGRRWNRLNHATTENWCGTDLPFVGHVTYASLNFSRQGPEEAVAAATAVAMRMTATTTAGNA